MGNHVMSCRHCDGDYQAPPYFCCAQAKTDWLEATRERLEEEAARQALFARHGIDFTVDFNSGTVTPKTESVVDLLRRLDKHELGPIRNWLAAL